MQLSSFTRVGISLAIAKFAWNIRKTQSNSFVISLSKIAGRWYAVPQKSLDWQNRRDGLALIQGGPAFP